MTREDARAFIQSQLKPEYQGCEPPFFPNPASSDIYDYRYYLGDIITPALRKAIEDYTTQE